MPKFHISCCKQIYYEADIEAPTEDDAVVLFYTTDVSVYVVESETMRLDVFDIEENTPDFLTKDTSV